MEQCENVEDEFLITMLFHTGLRIAELLSLTKASFDFNEKNGEDGEIVRQRWVTVIGKRNKQRDIPLDKTVCEVIDRLFAFKDLKHPKGWTRIMDTGYWPVYKRIGELAKKAGLEKHITPHTFRHSFATALRNNDQPIDIIQQLLGHSDIATTMIYAKAKNEKKVDAVNTLDNKGGA
jgi:site-specific recombinase XerD